MFVRFRILKLFKSDAGNVQQRKDGLLSAREGFVVASTDKVGDRNFAGHRVVVAEVHKTRPAFLQSVDDCERKSLLTPGAHFLDDLGHGHCGRFHLLQRPYQLLHAVGVVDFRFRRRWQIEAIAQVINSRDLVIGICQVPAPNR